jgi:hypothetical protein
MRNLLCRLGWHQWWTYGQTVYYWDCLNIPPETTMWTTCKRCWKQKA